MSVVCGAYGFQKKSLPLRSFSVLNALDNTHNSCLPRSCTVIVNHKREDNQKSDNLKFNTVGRCVNGTIVLKSDGPMFILIDWEVRQTWS